MYLSVPLDAQRAGRFHGGGRFLAGRRAFPQKKADPKGVKVGFLEEDDTGSFPLARSAAIPVAKAHLMLPYI